MSQIRQTESGGGTIQNTSSITITESYPDGMTREKYNELAMRQHARMIAGCLIRLYPEILRKAEVKKAA